MAFSSDADLLPVSPQAVAIAHAYVGLAIGLGSISSILFTTRIYARTKPVWSLGKDDWLAGLAFVSKIPFQPSKQCGS